MKKFSQRRSVFDIFGEIFSSHMLAKILNFGISKRPLKDIPTIALIGSNTFWSPRLL